MPWASTTVTESDAVYTEQGALNRIMLRRLQMQGEKAHREHKGANRAAIMRSVQY